MLDSYGSPASVDVQDGAGDDRGLAVETEQGLRGGGRKSMCQETNVSAMLPLAEADPAVDVAGGGVRAAMTLD
ncbi:MAG: hypothetical protein OXF75_13125 [Acidimicrobiaceae bacterium]|nr:hypothetical protein [Acidimicrobiaceae bacterium]